MQFTSNPFLLQVFSDIFHISLSLSWRMVSNHFSPPLEKMNKSKRKNTSYSLFRYQDTLPLLLHLSPMPLTSLPSQVLSISTEGSLRNQKSSGTSPAPPSSPPYASTLSAPSLKSSRAMSAHSISPPSPSKTLSSLASPSASWYTLFLILQYKLIEIDSLFKKKKKRELFLWL